ncbi:EMC3/TMCO1 family protein, partial [Nanoarchaeota archaeon]
MAFLEGVLNPVLDPLLNLGPFWAILIISLVISLLITLIYKLVTNQKKMKELKTEMKESQKKMKELKDQPEKVMAMQKAAMKKNLEYMKHSFKPTLITFIPIILIFGWLQGSLAFEPIMPGQYNRSCFPQSHKWQNEVC